MYFKLDEDVYENLNVIDQDCASIYKSAFQVLNSSELDDKDEKYVLASHSFREVIRALVRGCESQDDERLLTRKEKKVIENFLKNRNLRLEDNINTFLSLEKKDINELLENITNSLKTKLKEKLKMMFNIISETKRSKEIINNLSGAHKEFTRFSHHSEKKIKDEEYANLVNIFNKSVLDLTKPITLDLIKFDELLKKDDPDDNDINKLQDLLILPQHEFYFFKNLYSPLWFPKLLERHFFKDPPKADISEEGVRARGWPQTIYLKKISKKYPEELFHIIKDNKETNNPYVIDDFLEIMQLMELNFKDIKLLIKEWADYISFFYLISNRILELVRDVFQRSNDEDIIEGIRLLLGVKRKDTEEIDLYYNSLQPYLRFYDIKILINDIIPSYFKKYPVGIAELLSYQLDYIIRKECKKNIDDKPENDESLHWRRAIDDHVQNSRIETVKTYILCSLRNGLSELISHDKEKFKECYEILKKFNYSIFIRLRMYLLSLNGKDDFADEVLTFLTDIHYIEHPFYYHEIYLLLRTKFERLSQSNKEVILSNIIQSGELSDYLKHRLLYGIKDNLVNRHLDFFNDLHLRFGEPELPEFESYFVSSYGPSSPLEAVTIQKMSIEDLVNYLMTWKPVYGFHEPSMDGLASVLENVVVQDINKYILILEHSEILPHIYINHILYGIKRSIKESSTIDWNTLLDYLELIIKLPPKSELLMKIDEWETCSWAHILLNVADILEELCDKKWNKKMINTYLKIFQIAENLLWNDTPVEKQVKNLITSIDSSIIRVQRNYKSEAIDIFIGFLANINNMKISKSLKDEYVDKFLHNLECVFADRELLSAVISILGKNFQNLLIINKKWTLKNKNYIFPQDLNDQYLWLISWKNYIVYTQSLLREIPSIMREDYRNALILLKNYKNPEELIGNKLHYHIGKMYIEGIETLDIVDSLTVLYFENAPVRNRSILIIAMGEDYKDIMYDDNESERQIIIRYEEMWDWRLKVARDLISKGQLEQVLEEIEKFDIWFTLVPFDQEFAIKMLEQTLDLTNGKISFLYYDEFFNKLSNMDIQYLEKVLIICSKFLPESVGIYHSISHNLALTFLKNLSEKIQNKAQKDIFNKVIDDLVKKNYFQYRELRLR